MSNNRTKTSITNNIILVTVLLGLFLGLSYFFLNYGKNNPPESPKLVSDTYTCKYKGFESADKFLDNYTVKQGDTLLLIAKKQLGNTSRVNELAMLNLTRYPGFYSGTPGVPNLTPFLEIGWVLKIPPTWMPVTSGNLAVYNGRIISGVAGYDFGLSTTNGEDGRFSYFNVDNDTINSGEKEFKIGDCVTVLRDNITQKTIRIDGQ